MSRPAPPTADSHTAEQLRRAAEAFAEHFDGPPSHAAAAPGRVNLIGEHTDYNDGFVLPMAIDRQTVAVATPRDDSTIRLRSTGVDGEAILDLNQPIAALPGDDPLSWTNYLRGPIELGRQEGLDFPGLDCVVDSTVPAGGGLSSSASLEVAMLTLLESLSGTKLDPVRKALIAQQAEHEFAGMPCGIMDQFISAMGKPGHALLIDCRDHSTRDVPLDDPDLAVLIINSKVKHELTGGEYAERREQCEAAAKTIGVEALRDANFEDLRIHRDKLDPTVFRRAQHVLAENQRTLDFADALRERDYEQAGEKMFASHESLRRDFEVSTDELDLLVSLAQLQRGQGVIGSRMTGGGFGGCTVSLIEAAKAEHLIRVITREYQRTTGVTPDAFVMAPSAGARILDLPA
ncbi:MAG: galactokinase [Planctomycetota bacterium]